MATKEPNPLYMGRSLCPCTTAAPPWPRLSVGNSDFLPAHFEGSSVEHSKGQTLYLGNLNICSLMQIKSIYRDRHNIQAVISPPAKLSA